jgi:hypothetical protein
MLRPCYRHMSAGFLLGSGAVRCCSCFVFVLQSLGIGRISGVFMHAFSTCFRSARQQGPVLFVFSAVIVQSCKGATFVRFQPRF